MKLRNKKTGRIIELNNIDAEEGPITSLAELNAEWEDYEEPKEYWYYDTTGNFVDKITHLEDKEKDQAIGNYFETKEEAEKAVEKLKAWKRLKDKGFRFKTFQRNPQGTYDIYANWEGYIPPLSRAINKDLNLLFGGEE